MICQKLFLSSTLFRPQWWFSSVSFCLSLSQTNIEPCPECGHLKQKHILCGFCYAKVCRETARIRQQIQAMEGGPLRAPSVETVILYEGEAPSQQDKDKRIVERPRKRPAWFSYWGWGMKAVCDAYHQTDTRLLRYTVNRVNGTLCAVQIVPSALTPGDTGRSDMFSSWFWSVLWH